MRTVPAGHKPWAPIFQDLVACTPPKTIINFELLWRDPQPSWTSPAARVVQIGDCAHSFLPASGNGATQAIEDAVSLASCLQIGGRENIARSVKAHVRLRYVYLVAGRTDVVLFSPIPLLFISTLLRLRTTICPRPLAILSPLPPPASIPHPHQSYH